MGHPAIDNATPFAFEPLFLADEEGRPLFVPVVKATYSIHPRQGLAVAEKQLPVDPGGKFWGDPDTSSYKYEPECAFIKLATDVALIGHAHAPNPRTTELDVKLRVGPLEKIVRVVGDRKWVKGALGVSATDPKPFERMPLIWERAFGGTDRTDPDPAKHTLEPRNPVGIGMRQKDNGLGDGVPLPNLEDPKRLLRGYGDAPPPAGFGFTGPSWQPRAAFAGTYNDAWMKSRMPLLPKDFDRRFFNAAAPGLIASGFLKGNEPVVIDNVLPGGSVAFSLPGVPAPEVLVALARGEDQLLRTQLDTVIINTDEKLLLLIWRAHLVVRNGPHDVRSIRISAEGVALGGKREAVGASS
ncbi:MAG: DUF2169 domain-containing protein [Gemmataceae bacterium]|nr:DUF2169 domain-containing protein [Gemmataceae bacterium]MCI0738270.1 DUF2169 domain-containing protein [Gemmataceae bacterium]